MCAAHFLSRLGSPVESLKRVLDSREDGDKFGADVVDAGDDDDRNARSDKAIFDGRRAGLVFRETLDQINHWVPFFVCRLRHDQITESFK